ncbi:hypothetical protein E2C01_014664 [Portunus trituberculatus]|uniref:Uncharacterized protein n=1 Tax=Portunus trituberculatus TaxID=210409 RepID=A0A5B7DJG5_PORTR|nr:hypothetical protein [Portunus trituberculatus]
MNMETPHGTPGVKESVEVEHYCKTNKSLMLTGLGFSKQVKQELKRLIIQFRVELRLQCCRHDLHHALRYRSHPLAIV